MIKLLNASKSLVLNFHAVRVLISVPKVTTPAKVLNCKDHGCEQSCSEVDGDVKCECNAGYSLKVDGKSCEGSNVNF